MRPFCLLLCIHFAFISYSQNQKNTDDSQKIAQDSIKKVEIAKSLGNGYLPLYFINLDLRYLVKYNQYEGFRTGLGGITNDKFSEIFKLEGYLVYGFRDDKFKNSISGGFRIAEKTNTWLHLSYAEDLEETGSSKFLTDKRFFQFFEPRLINIDLFHKHITKALTLEHRASPSLLSETQLSISKIDPTYAYTFNLNGNTNTQYNLSLAKIALQWNPFDLFTDETDELIEGYPQFSLQYTKSFKEVFNGAFNFSKLDFRTVHNIEHANQSATEFGLSAGLALGNTPITHMYHSSPNNVNKETIFRRFSVAGINSFETMFFNEFFSDRFSILQIKHKFKPIKISDRFIPEIVVISRYAIGNMNNINRHQGITFNTLNKGFTESGLEINKLLFGFGLSFAYRYGAYHLPVFEDNIALKFTFNINL